ncbi:MAG: NifU N-terminal domain-containing protein [Acidimicrobiia bacterium]
MGQEITVSSRNGVSADVKHFSCNRSLTGMQTLRYHFDEEVAGDKPPDVLARRLFALGGIQKVTIYSSEVTVSAPQWAWLDIEDKVRETIANLFIHYGEGAAPPDPKEAGADGGEGAAAS